MVTEDDNLYEKCPRLSEELKENVDRDLTNSELWDAFAMCKDSAPGTYRIPYSVNKKLWGITGPYIDGC